MGRYYTGDIEGKFWFGVQDSTDAKFFGGEEIEPNFVEYYFSPDDLSSIVKGIKKCKEELGEFKAKIDQFFNSIKGGYTDEQLSGALKLSATETHQKLEWYARLELGEKIHKCVKENKSCSFQAEL